MQIGFFFLLCAIVGFISGQLYATANIVLSRKPAALTNLEELIPRRNPALFFVKLALVPGILFISAIPLILTLAAPGYVFKAFSLSGAGFAVIGYILALVSMYFSTRFSLLHGVRP